MPPHCQIAAELLVNSNIRGVLPQLTNLSSEKLNTRLAFNTLSQDTDVMFEGLAPGNILWHVKPSPSDVVLTGGGGSHEGQEVQMRVCDTVQEA